MNSQKSEAIYSRTVKAGQRYYYIDAKCDSKGNKYVVLTESKNAEPGSPMLRSKIFLYEEDFGKFAEALQDVLAKVSPGYDSKPDFDSGLSLDELLASGSKLLEKSEKPTDARGQSLLDSCEEIKLDLDISLDED